MNWRPRRPLHFALIALAVLMTLPPLGTWWLTRPTSRDVGAPPEGAGLTTQRVELALSDGARVAGWDVAIAAPRAALLVLHGRGSSRGAMRGRGELLARLRCASLLLDLPGHGESAGDVVTLGAREAALVQPALHWLRERWPGAPIGAIGISMGGAALCLAPAPLDVRFVVLESTYATLDQAIEERIARYLGPLAPGLRPLASGAYRFATGCDAASVRPVDTIAQIGCPLLLLHGREDRSTRFAQAQALFAAARAPKELAAIVGADHEDLLKHSPAEYELLLRHFLDAHLTR